MSVGEGVAGIILAGGQSRRMGRDKATLRLDGETLLHRTLEVMTSIAHEVVVVGGEQRLDLPPHVRYLEDEIADAGPLAGLLTGLRAIRASYAAVVACDLPFLDASLLAYLICLAAGHQAVVPIVDGRRQVLHAVYARSAAGAAETQLAKGVRKLESFLERLRVRYVPETEINDIDPDHRSFVNVNTAEEWQDALRRHRSGGRGQRNTGTELT